MNAGTVLHVLRGVLLTLVFVACGSDPDPHELGACEGWKDNQGNPITVQCEAACRTPPMATGTSCDTLVQMMCNAFEFDHVRGCCVQDQSGPIRFAECYN